MINEDENRPNPEDLLEMFKKEESRQRKGKLKIFLGMAAGVGKTYCMLEAAQKLTKQDVDVLIGTIDTHGRKDTEALLQGLKTIPEKQVEYKETVFKELDLDEIIKRKPQIILVDELAHSNVPGSRHPKRWQDILEILDNGIDVYTTLNVQHIESLKDLVEKVTGITIRETVPDLILDIATSIELIDLTPGDLLQRLKEGKVYLAGQSTIAAKNFFQEDRLTALREIVLRYTAEKVEHELQGMTTSAETKTGWKVRDKLLVAISSSPHTQKLIRITRRLAFNLDAPWIAVHVDDGRYLNEEDRETLAKNLALARDLGGEVITTSDPDIASAIQRIARQRSVTQIIIGRPPIRHFFELFKRKTLMDRLAEECSDIDLHVIRQPLIQKSSGQRWSLRFSSQYSSYIIVGLSVCILTLFNWLILPYIGYQAVGFVFLLGILLLSLFFRKGPIFFGSTLYALIWLLVFAHPTGVQHPLFREDYILLAFYLLTAIFTGILIDRGRKHKELLIKRERSIGILYEIIREIAGASSLEEVLLTVKRGLSSALNGECEIFMKQMNNGLDIDESSSIGQDEKEKAAVNWVFHNGTEAGWSTTTLPFAKNLYIPLQGSNESVGVLAFRRKEAKDLNIEEKNFLYTIGQQLANYIERLFSEEKTKELEQHKQVEKIYQSTLNLISNLFEGPLLTIKDAVKVLKETQTITEEIGISPFDQITTSLDSLTHILDNISAMVNLSAGNTPINKVTSNLSTLLTMWHDKIRQNITNYQWTLRIEENVPLLDFDHDLIELLFYNLAFHAIEFAPPESNIDVECVRATGYVVLSLSSQGQTIPDEIIDVAFENFYRIPGGIKNLQATQGLGLGLAIAKTIAEIHGGFIRIAARSEGGMTFSLSLPISKS